MIGWSLCPTPRARVWLRARLHTAWHTQGVDCANLRLLAAMFWLAAHEVEGLRAACYFAAARAELEDQNPALRRVPLASADRSHSDGATLCALWIRSDAQQIQTILRFAPLQGRCKPDVCDENFRCDIAAARRIGRQDIMHQQNGTPP